MLTLCLTFWGTAKLISTVATPFYIPTGNSWGFHSPNSWQHLLYSAFFFFFHNSHPNGYEVISYCSFDLISLMISDIDHLFMCWLAIWIFSLEKCLFNSSTHFLNQIVFWVVEVLYIFCILIPFQIYYLQVYSPMLWAVISLYL